MNIKIVIETRAEGEAARLDVYKTTEPPSVQFETGVFHYYGKVTIITEPEKAALMANYIKSIVTQD